MKGARAALDGAKGGGAMKDDTACAAKWIHECILPAGHSRFRRGRIGMRSALAALALLAGCAERPCPSGGCEFLEATAESTALVERVVWRGVYGRSDAPVPTTWVEWGDCNGWGQSFSAPMTQACLLGWTDPGLTHSWVMRGDLRTLAHEMLHVHLARAFGDGDPDHLRPEWGALAQRANDAIWAAQHGEDKQWAGE